MNRLTRLMTLLCLGTLLLAACSPAATPTPTQPPAPTQAPAQPTKAPESTQPPAQPTSAPAPATNALKVEDGATIVFSGWGDETEQKIYKDSIARFNQDYPNVKVDYQPIPTDFQTKLKAAMAGGTAPDVFYVDDQLMTAFGPTGQLLPLDDYLKQGGVNRSDFLAPLLTIFTQDGKTFALPKDWGTLGLVYLPEAFKAAGIPEPTADWTWDDLKTAAAAIAKTGKYGGFCMGADWARFAPFAFSNGGTFVSDDQKTAQVDTPQVTQAADFVAAMKKDGSLKTASDLGASWCGEAIGKKLAGITTEGGWMVNFMRQNYKDVEWKAVPIPSGAKGKADIIFTNGIGVNAKTKYPEAAAALALYLTGRDNQGEIVKTGFAYSTHPDQVDLVQDPNDKAIAQGGTYPLTRVAYWGPNTGKVNDSVSKALERVFLGDQTVAESFKQAQQEIQATLDEQSGTSSTPAQPAAGSTIAVEDGANVVFSGWGDETEQKVYKDSIARFNQLYPNVKVDYQPIPTDFQTKLKAAMAGGTAPDVFYVDDQLMTAFGPTGQLLALDDFMKQASVSSADFLAPLLTLFTQDGKTLALPKDWGTLGLVYLPEAFKAAGIAEPTSSWTWDDLKKAAEAIAKTGKYAGFCMGADWARFAPFVFSAGGSFVSSDQKQATLDTPEVKQAAELVATMKKDGSLKTASDLGASWCGEAIGKKLAGMTTEGGWMVNFMRQNYKDVDWKAATIPAGAKGQADVIFTNGIGVNAKTKFPEAAAALALFLTGRENQGEIVKTGFAYSTHPDQVDLVQDPNDKAIAQGGTFPLTRVAYWGPNTGKINDAVSKALERVFLGDQTVDESLKQLQSDVTAILNGQ